MLQLGGDFVVDHAGILRFAHQCHDPSDRPSTHRLIEEIRRVIANPTPIRKDGDQPIGSNS